MVEFIVKELFVVAGICFMTYPVSRWWHAGKNHEMKRHFDDVTKDIKSKIEKEEQYGKA